LCEFTTKLELFSKKFDSAFVCAASVPVCNWLQNPQNFPFIFSKKSRPLAKKKRVENFSVFELRASEGGSSAL